MTRDLRELAGRLAPARPSRPISPGERIHVLGIAGAGASAAALHARAAGAIVTGCDPGGRSPYTAALEAIGIPMEWRHDPAHIAAARPDRLAVTKALTAINPDHPELLAAASAGVALEPWQQLVADAAHGRELVAVAGTHGKSTTAGWLAWILAEAGLDPSAFVGALLPAALSGGIPATGRVGRGDPFVVEADEYAGNFDPYRPRVVALTTIEWDHPDVFADRAAVIEAFARWLSLAPEATIVANLGDPGVAELLSRLDGVDGRHVIGTSVIGAVRGGAPQGGDTGPGERRSELVVDRQVTGTISERTPDGTVLEIDGLDASSHRVHLPIPGDHNASNALVALAAAWVVAGGTTSSASGVDAVQPDRLLWGLASFPGIGRRLERKGEARGVVVYDDYGHHPTAIRATLDALRQREPDRRLWAVYEPLTFHRTAAMLDDFADALAEADAVAVANIWASRDPDTTITSSGALATAVRRRRPGIPAEAPGTVEETATWLARNVEAGDAVLVMGGGKSYRIAEILLEALHGDR
ncbi:MAG TPA: cyanophycin synthetase [Candidatus Limnocylindrales bacterium]|nr:cyanophycin synthetase [Candidatus Limnocylindrales bacterium]